MSGYLHKQVDLDAIFEQLSAGDTKYAVLTGHRNEVGTDLRDLYVPITKGSMVAQDVGYAIQGTDLRQVFAAKGSVSRYATPLPWDTTINGSLTPAVFRQLGRGLKTYSHFNGTIYGDGRVVLTMKRPWADSRPDNYYTDVLHSADDTRAWTPTAGVSYEVKAELVLGDGITLTGGNLNTWISLPTADSKLDIAKTLTYVHDLEGEGEKLSSASLRIHVRRADFPTTNLTSGDLKLNLLMKISPVLFEEAAWNNPQSAALTGVNHVPGNTDSLTAATGFIVSSTGDVTYLTTVNNQWVQTATHRWYKSTIDAAYQNDFEYRVVAVSGDTGYVTNPVTAWQTVNPAAVVYLSSTATKGTVPGTYSRQATVRVEIRQKSTRGYAQGGINLADNQISRTITLGASIQIVAPIAVAWPNMTAWSQSRDFVTNAAWLPESSATISSSASLSFLADGTVQVLENGGVIATGTWLPTGYSTSNIEMVANMSASGTGASNESNTASSWGSPVGKKVTVTNTRRHVDGVGNTYRTYSGTVSFRRKDWPSDTVSVTVSLKVTANITGAALLAWNHAGWAGTYNATSSIPWTPESPNTTEAQNVLYSFFPDGRIVITRTDGVVLKEGTWLPAGISASQIEATASVTSSSSGTQGTGSGIVNPFTGWVNMGQVKTVMVSVFRKQSDGVGTSQFTAQLNITFRRISNPADSSSALAASTVSQTFTSVGLLAWNMNGWKGTHDYKKVVLLNPDTPTAKVTATMQLVVAGNGQIIIKKDGVTYLTNSWLPAGASASDIEARFVTNQVISGSDLDAANSGTDNQLSAWTTLGTDKTVTITTTRPHVNVGFSSLGTSGLMYFRRKANPTDAISFDFAMYSRVTHDYPTPIGLSLVGAWLSQTYNLTTARNPSGAGTTYGRVFAVFAGTGVVTVYRQYNGETAQVLASGRWYDSSIPAGQVELIAVMGNPSGISTVSNGIPAWSGLVPGQDDLVVSLTTSANHASAPYTSTGIWEGTISTRRKSYPSETASATLRMVINNGISGAANTLVPSSTYTQWAKTFTNSNVTAEVAGQVSSNLNRFDQSVIKTTINVSGYNSEQYGTWFTSSQPGILWTKNNVQYVWSVHGHRSNRTLNTTPNQYGGALTFAGVSAAEYNNGPDLFTVKSTNSSGQSTTHNYTKFKLDGSDAIYVINGTITSNQVEIMGFVEFMKAALGTTVRVEVTPIIL